MKAAFLVVAAFAAGFVGRRFDVGGASGTSAAEIVELEHRVAAVESARDVAAPQSTIVHEAALAASDRRVEALESRVAAAVRRTSDAAVPAAADVEADVDPESRRLSGLVTPALLEAVRDLGRAPNNQDGLCARALAACDALLARRIEMPLRSEVLKIKGANYQRMGEFDKAEATLREALGLVERTSKEGVGAAIQLAFNPALQFDCRTAAQRFLDIAAQSDLPADVRALCRNHAAKYFAAAKDFDRARENHRTAVEEFGTSDDTMARYWANQSRTAIDKLDADAR